MNDIVVVNNKVVPVETEVTKRPFAWLKDIVSKFERYLNEHNFSGMYSLGVHDWDGVMEMEINWGDWKHEHLRADWLFRDFLKEYGYEGSWEEVVTETNGSDCYSALHYYTVRPKEVV